jgi:hypothetical protein
VPLDFAKTGLPAEPKPEPRRAPLSERSECVSGHPSTGPESIYVDGKGAQRCGDAGGSSGASTPAATANEGRPPPRPVLLRTRLPEHAKPALGPGGDPLPLVRRGGVTAPGSIRTAAATAAHANARRVIQPEIDQSRHPIQPRSAARGHLS